MCTLRLFRLLLFSFVCLLMSGTLSAAILIPRGASWNYFKGRAEASTPIEAWRTSEFNDESWDTANAPFRYGDGTGGLLLSDMRYNYNTVYLRRTFNVTDVNLISRLDLHVDYDDGFMVWINGELVRAVNNPGNPLYNSTAPDNHESGSFEIFELANPASFLQEGENTIAIQVFNVSRTSSDLMMNPELVSTAPDNEPPVVLEVTPAPGKVMELKDVTVRFSEVVQGVSASDLTINGVPANSLTANGDEYTFRFGAVPLGAATMEWSQDHGIVDTASPANPFDAENPGEVRVYQIVDEQAPVMTAVLPTPDLTIRSLEQLSVTFSESVTGVEARDLLAGGREADSVSGSGIGPYLFVFDDGIPNGPVTLRWANDAGIVDQAADPNQFPGGEWSYTIDPDASVGELVINEILAANRGGRTDEDGEASDWIELRNAGPTPINLGGWSLSDNPDEPGKFVLPERTIPAGGYLLVVASGKDRRPEGAGEIHTNFKLAASGEYLGLFTPELPREVADELEPEFPVQRNDHSYGRDSLGDWRYYANPSPARANGHSSIRGLLDPPHVNVSRGFYTTPFNLAFTSTEPGVTIRYTTNGSEPTASNGSVYSNPIRVTSTRAIRAAAFKSGFLPSEIISHTYLYNVPSSHRSLPVVSLTTDNSNLWGPTGIQETNPRNCAQRGIAWERPVSMELIYPEDNSGTHENCGLRVQGGNYIRGRYNPNGGLPFSKYSFRLYFRGDYGPTMLEYPFFKGSEVEIFDRITLRAGMNDHSNPFIVDELVRRLQIDTGNVGARGDFVNLFINGVYKGYYNATERIDDDFMRSWHGGDDAWDVIAQFGEVREGDASAWNQLVSLLNRDMTDPSNYQAVLEMLDVDNFIDYLLVNTYCGTGDWPHNNWRAARERKTGAKFRFYVWDAEWALGNQGRSVNGNTLTGELGGNSDIARFYRSLHASPEFRLRWADRAHKHFYNGGVLEDARIRDHYDTMRSVMSGVLPGMSSSIANSWIPQRRGIIMQHMSNAELLRSADAPVFSQMGGPVRSGDLVTLSAPGGTIYYTLDGSDPREPIGSNAGGFSRTLLAESAAKRVHIPNVASAVFGNTWTGGDEPFNDAGWTAGNGAVGYDENNDYRALIDIDVIGMNNTVASCYIRIPFSVSADDLEGVNFMQLKARYDDGFVAYLNGVRMIGPNGPASTNWDSEATANHSDSSAVNLRGFNVSEYLSELKVGENMLAIHGLNDGTGSSDFLNSVELVVGENLSGGVSANALEYTNPLSFSGSTVVKARTLRAGVWSAITEATFLSGPDVPTVRITEIMYNPDGGSYLEFIELHNFGTLPVDLGRMNFRGISYTFSPGTLLGPGEYLVLASNNDPDRFAAQYPGTRVFGTYAGSLSNGGERLQLLDGKGRTILSVDYDDEAGWPEAADGDGPSLVLIDPMGDSDAPANWRLSRNDGGSPGAADPAASQPKVRVNEVLVDNVNAIANGGGYPAMVELYNPGNSVVSLKEWGLSDDGDDPHKYEFPSFIQINPRSYLRIWCYREPRGPGESRPGIDAGFGLDPQGGSVFLTDAEGDRVDAVSFGLQVPDYSISRVGSDWVLTPPTPGAVNNVTTTLAPSSQIDINEWLADREAGKRDWLELFNKDPNHPVALQGLYFGNGETTYRYGALSFLAPRGFVRLWADEESGPTHLGFRLPKEGANLTVTDSEGAVVESVSYSLQTEGVSRGRIPDGGNSLHNFPTTASPGAPNYRASNPGLRITEVLAGNEPGWIELKNTSNAEMVLGDFSLSIGSREPGAWRFDGGVSVPSGEYLLIACDSSREADASAGNLNTGAELPLGGGAIYLFGPEDREIDRIEFGSQISGKSIGKAFDTGLWNLTAAPTPGAKNGGAISFGSVGNLRINEWLANAGLQENDYVEIYNRGTQPVKLSGLGLTDDLSTVGRELFRFPDLSFIGGSGYLALVANNSPELGHLPFGLDSRGETLRLYRASGSLIINEVTWGIEEESVSSGRSPDGDANIEVLAFQSPGRSNLETGPVDDDGDGMEDAWELAHGLDPADPNDATQDGDGDGFDNLAEYRSGTDPADGRSHLKLASALLVGDEFQITFQAEEGIRYAVQSSEDLVSWDPFETVAAGAARPVTVTDAVDRGMRYYRLVAERGP